MSLTSVDYLRALYGTTTATDALLDALRVCAERAVKEFAHRDLERATYTEYASGNGTRVLYLRHRPVVSVTSVHYDPNGWFGYGNDPFPSATLLTAGTEYALAPDRDGLSYAGRLVRINDVWQEIPRIFRPGKVAVEPGLAYGNLKVIYVAGYDPVPDDVQYAVAMLVSYMRRTVNFGQNIQSEKLGDYGYHLARTSLRDVPELGTTRQVLSSYREVVL